MKKTILFLILVIFLSAGATKCTLISRPKTIDIYKGTEGIAMEFFFFFFPDKISENTEFQIIVNIKNKGASNVRDGYLSVNLEKDYVDIVYYDWSFDEGFNYGIYDEQVEFDLEGKSQFNPNGVESIIKIIAKTKEIEELMESHISTIGLTACYKYLTIANPTICVDPDVHNLRIGEKSCVIKDISLISQGAPVAVTKIEQNMLTHEDKIEPQFLIYLANKGNGQIVNKEDVEEACSAAGLGKDTWNVINITAYLSGKELDCNPNPVKLTKTKDFVRCSAFEYDWIDKDLLAYESILNINLTYGYTSTISKDIKIEKQY